MTRVVVISLFAGILVSGFAAWAEEAPQPISLLDRIEQNPTNVANLVALKEAIAAEADRNEVGRLSVVYALACLSAGRDEEAQKVRRFLAAKYMDHPCVKYLTSQYLDDVCDVCEGTLKEQRMCPKCHGEPKCAACGGSGKQKLTGFDKAAGPCLACKGSGHCTVCEGSGTTAQPCRNCGNSGRAPSRRKMLAAMHLCLHPEGEGTAPPDVTGERALQALVRQVTGLPAAYAEATSALRRDNVFSDYTVPLASMLRNQSVTLTGKVKGVTAMDDGKALIRTEGFLELRDFGADVPGVRFTAESVVMIAASREAVQQIASGQDVIVSGKLAFAAQDRAAPDASQILLRCALRSPERTVGTVYMTEYSCKIGRTRYVSPFQ